MQDQDIAREAESLSAESRRLYCVRHSLAHIMAQAVLEFRPGTKLGFGPPVENGFYYDFDLSEPIVAEDLPKIEKRMREIARRKVDFVREEMSSADAIARIETMGQPYKDEASHDLEVKGVGMISFYTNGSFIDMCEGPHVANSSEIPLDAFKLDSIAGAYWRGDEKNKMLTRIYGLAFATKEELDAFIERRKIALERDHRKLGRELDLFHIEELIGKGLILWLPNGTVHPRRDREARSRGRVPLRVRARRDPAHRAPGALLQERAPAVLQGEHVPADAVGGRGEGRGLLPEADELPAPPHDLRESPAFVSRSAVASRGVRDLLPVREVRRARWTAARAVSHDERRAHLLHPRAGEGRGDLGHAALQGALRSLRPEELLDPPVDARPGEPEKFHERRGALGAVGGDPARRASRRRRSVRGRVRRGGLLRPEDRRPVRQPARSRGDRLDRAARLHGGGCVSI